MKELLTVLRRSPLFQKGRFKENVSLKEMSAFKIGGAAEVFFEPENETELRSGLLFFKKNGIPVSIIGGAANLLIADSGIKGAVIKLGLFDSIKILNEENGVLLVQAGAGVLTDSLTKWACMEAVSGLEAFGALPGTVGGAAFMNARCYDTSFSDVFFSARVMPFDGVFDAYECTFDTSEWSYKRSPFQKKALGIAVREGRNLILSVTFKLTRGEKNLIAAKTAEKYADRVEKGHFKKPSAGSVFKNNRAFGAPCGKIIDEAGLKGLSIGGAQIPPWHGNFIINNGEACAEDVRKLIETVQKTVAKKSGFMLEPEIIFAGF